MAIKFTFSPGRSEGKYLEIEMEMDISGEKEVILRLPSWRPGRYERGNFAKNIRKFEVRDEERRELPFEKLTMDSWRVTAAKCGGLRVSYNYYAGVLDAGSTFISDSLVFINPVNCCLFSPGRMEEEIEVVMELPERFTIATSLKKEGFVLYARDFDQLADSPVMASPNIFHHKFLFLNKPVHFWFYENPEIEMTSFQKDVEAFSAEQAAVFGDFPCDEFHYLFLTPKARAYHGVEHTDSTAVLFGPVQNLAIREWYNEFLGLCSHEFFHVWNIKRIRPAAMLPYDFTVENYSTLGYVYEGITTYYGDLTLFRSGHFSFSEYAGEMGSAIRRHFDNFGRYHASLASSSLDTWLDGYQSGAPFRKVSIYGEGMLAAFILDIRLRSGCGKSLDDVMKAMYQRFGKTGKGYSEEDYLEIIEELSGEDFGDYFSEIIHGVGGIENEIERSLNRIGLKLESTPSGSFFERYFGFRLKQEGGSLTVAAIAPGSPAALSGMTEGDRLVGINGVKIEPGISINGLFETDEDFFNQITLTDQYLGDEKELVLAFNQGNYFPDYKVVKNTNANMVQKDLYRAWCKHDF